jgi:hypothetical protein
MDQKFFEMLINQASDAAKRTRWILSAAMVISLAQLGAAYNFTYGFLRTFSEQMILNPTAENNPRLKDLQDMLMRSWIDQLSVNVNLFGIKFSAADASLIGSVSLLTISIWLFYSSRRENHIIGKTCILANNSHPKIKNQVFYGLSNIQLFGTLSNNDEPFKSLRHNSTDEVGGARYLVSILFYLPAITVFAMIAMDILSLVQLKAVFRGSAETLYHHLTTTPIKGSDPVRYLWSDVWPTFFTTVGIEVAVAIFLTHIIRSAAKYQTGTIRLLKELQLNGWAEYQPEPIQSSDTRIAA